MIFLFKILCKGVHCNPDIFFMVLRFLKNEPLFHKILEKNSHEKFILKNYRRDFDKSLIDQGYV